MHHFEKVFVCFPQEIQRQIQTLDPYTKEHLQEIRVYKQKEVQIFAAGKHFKLNGRMSERDIHHILNNLLKFSYYAYEEDLAKGFVTIDGGHRVGICGRAVVEKGSIKLIREISSFNIRCGKEIIGCSDEILHHVIGNNRIHNILIVSPPGCGKTTLLRDITRNLSQKQYKVAICDERSEIAGMYGGVSSYEMGTMVDVLDGCPKAEGMMMLIRSMSPQVIITDEIGREEDLKAIESCVHCGVAVITSVHGYDMEELHHHPIYECIQRNYFDKVIFLTDMPAPGSIREVIDV